MTQEEKQLLLVDLCARLPYNPMVEYKGEAYNVLGIAHGRLVLCKPFMSHTLDETPLVEEVKPYLFSLSSMTERQCYELSSIRSSFQDCWKYIKTPIPLSICNFEQIEWFHKNHLDYRGLIEKGLAIDCTNLKIY